VRILVIDDEPLVADVVAEALRLEDHDVVVASTGKEGLRIIAENPPDAVFLDIIMPGMDGIEVLRAIREWNLRLPVIILSGWVSQSQLEEARRLGVTEVISKPVPLKNLTRALRQ
jgi:CheY-like chemotaxis protein